MNIPIIISIISIIINIILGYIFSKKFDKYKRTSDKKFDSYSELINLAKPFIDDPGLNFKEAKNMSNHFIEKYNNEILPFAPKEVVEAVQNFLYNSGTKFADENKQTKALSDIIQAIRKDLGLEKLDGKKIEFHAINEENLKQKYIQSVPNSKKVKSPLK